MMPLIIQWMGNAGDNNCQCSADSQFEDRPLGSIDDPDKITPEMVKYLGQTQVRPGP